MVSRIPLGFALDEFGDPVAITELQAADALVMPGALNEAPIVTLASAATVNIGAAAANTIVITGNATINALGTIPSGAVRRLVFQGSPTITHNATSLILPKGQSLQAAEGDVIEMTSEGSGNWVCTGFLAGSVSALAGAIGAANKGLHFTAQGILETHDQTARARTFLAAGSAAAQRSVLSVREQLTANRSYFVRTDGNDSNTGLANTAGGAFLTLQKAVDVAASLDVSIYTVTIQVADGAYPGSVVLKPYVGVGPINIIGNEGAPANVVLGPGTTTISGTGFGKYLLAGCSLSSTLRNIEVTGAGAILEYRNIISNTTGTTNTHMNAREGAVIQARGSVTINGTAALGFSATRFGLVVLSGQSVIFGAGATFTSRGFTATNMGQLDMFSVTFTGSFTGSRYLAQGLSLIFTNGAGETYIPGSSAGVVSSGGVYF